MPRPRNIFSIVGLPPEVLAVAMAKYSRSTHSIKETIDELTEEKSAEFHEKWVLGYGDASVADMAVIAIAIENVSILSSKIIQDNRLAAYQEKSTRYVEFDADSYIRPTAIMASAEADRYVQTADMLFAAYRQVLAGMTDYYRGKYPKLTDQTEKMYEAKLKARALDVARYLLPTATLTNFGLIMSARSLRHAIAKLKGNPLPEAQEIGAAIEQAAVNPGYNPVQARSQPMLEAMPGLTAEQKSELAKTFMLQIKGAPTLVKHTDPKPYIQDIPAIAGTFAVELGLKREDGPRVDFVDEPLHPEDQLLTWLLYSGCQASYRTIAAKVRALPMEKKETMIEAVQSRRGERDAVSRHFEIPAGFVFDTLFDYGAFRDLQRHRLTTQVNQPLTLDHGYEVPRDLEDADLLPTYRQAMETAADAVQRLANDFPEESKYLIPMGYKKRTLFAMNLREFHHFVELRSKSGGHFSYRALVYDMYEQVKKRHPLLVKHLRAVKMNFAEDFYKR